MTKKTFFLSLFLLTPYAHLSAMESKEAGATAPRDSLLLRISFAPPGG